jgi:hypothetical protein
MGILNSILTALFDTVYAVLGLGPRWLSLVLLSAVVGVIALIVVRYCSNQAAIGRVKDDIKANMLSLKLFKDELRVVLKAQARLVRAGLKMQYYMLPPLLVMFIPFVLIAAQMGLRYQWRPVDPGEPTDLTVRLRPDAPDAALNWVLQAPEGVEATPSGHGVRISADRKAVVWNLTGRRPGRFVLTLQEGDRTVTKEFVVGDGQDRVSPKRPGPSLLDRILYPAEQPFGSASVIESIAITYPARESWFHGADWWIVWFLVLSIVAALLLKSVFGVKL